MNLIKTKIEDLVIIEPKIFTDDRGYFFESYNKKKLEVLTGKQYNFVQDNESKSSYGVIRGLHYQLAPYSQAKLVRVLKGKVYDVAVDLRKNSPTFGEWVGVELSAENKRQFLIPKGFAHGFSVLSETAVFTYKCDEYYHPEAEAGIIYNDSSLRIDWKVPEKDIKLSEKDKLLPEFGNAKMNF
ncbi:dTDP-4-dehydrorhamnose 3,5-epimerase [Methanosarcina thermophila]|jgi:dTDP-4-dehydrorhamnose 3,5-epimerase|uniref:dTDP-4-dehydrorhamnose 3,5-epimerase n=4 Tax=Methanosarcina TaxID=2207 RepID=A0A1I6XP99_METTE|nr:MULTISPECIES: dTDP-4-dehydrorhamnose 3,5-epimerase [Methanosarcina]ALK05631.1 MAG: dTDP-4-dehydrorhamnose 3,5-epimerase [Methanosarcina sp. 795]AKB12928.1 dTDP-4-dehydrorhamnose 3,5-epimerase [Methanosarcina thermophila TM-1]AKB16451.1 dTDP-4-dehydrorhamnose 3,5-epimerase [Methanosarcina thermophila CHTI-55]AYK15562.1 dTDP-4-dehydrorhamnose 3,5-epimerase [Methanosarcina flavescens]NLK33676.1 dTDP-4-dehydrorhamnose 3,5-epimerase [Methanosarcina flavescens]